jgi:hypothetical protein
LGATARLFRCRLSTPVSITGYLASTQEIPDIVCDARELTTLEEGLFDAVYCSHNLEH